MKITHKIAFIDPLLSAPYAIEMFMSTHVQI